MYTRQDWFPEATIKGLIQDQNPTLKWKPKRKLKQETPRRFSYWVLFLKKNKIHQTFSIRKNVSFSLLLNCSFYNQFRIQVKKYTNPSLQQK